MSLTLNLGSSKLATSQAQKEVTINTAFDEIDSTLAGRLSKSVAGSANINLTRTEALNAFFIFTGALTGNIEVRWPASGGTARNLRVYNATTGAFTLTLVVAGGSGVAITQGEIRDFAIDGTTVRPTNATAGTYTQASAQAIWARVFHNVAQSIANDTLAALAFNSERADTDTIHDNATNNSRLTATTAGVYLITATVDFAANATGVRVLNLRLNGTTMIAGQVTNGISTLQTRLSVSTIYSLAATNYIEALVYQNSTAALNVESTGNVSPEFMMIRLGGA